MKKCEACGDVPPLVGCGRVDCPFPENVELRKKMEAYKKRVLESRKRGFAG